MAFTSLITSHVETISSTTEPSKKIALSTLFIAFSLLIGPVLFIICSAMGMGEGNEKFLILSAFMVMGFELTWIIYGLAAWVRGAFYISDEYSDFTD